jgi:DNA polymerase I-like protein with 3'-5' exonuclease and polymerase domains
MAIHDSLWVHAPIDEMEVAREMVETEMIRALPMSVPLSIELQTTMREPRETKPATSIFPQDTIE